MAVKKKVSREIENFIDKGAAVKSEREILFKNILLRIPVNLLNKLDEEVSKKPWLARTQWIVIAIYEKLNSDMNEEKEGLGARD
jgi:hypothetical protein